jgi:glycosyltransferase involved in cell wall biosynthesis
MIDEFCVVIPVKNCVNHIDNAIESIINQDVDLIIRIHIQDGGSTDGTLMKILEWEEKLSSLECANTNIRIFTYASEHDNGMYEAINKGFSHLKPSDNSLMYWLNADDTIESDRFKIVKAIFSKFPTEMWLIGWFTFRNVDGSIRLQDRLRYYPRAIVAAGLSDGMHWPCIPQESVFWKGKIWRDARGLNKRFKLAGDWDLWRRFALLQSPLHMEEFGGCFHARDGQLSNDAQAYYQEIDSHLPFNLRYNHLINWNNQGWASCHLIQRDEDHERITRVAQPGIYALSLKIAALIQLDFKRILQIQYQFLRWRLKKKNG